MPLEVSMLHQRIRLGLHFIHWPCTNSFPFVDDRTGPEVDPKMLALPMFPAYRAETTVMVDFSSSRTVGLWSLILDKHSLDRRSSTRLSPSLSFQCGFNTSLALGARFYIHGDMRWKRVLAIGNGDELAMEESGSDAK